MKLRKICLAWKQQILPLRCGRSCNVSLFQSHFHSTFRPRRVHYDGQGLQGRRNFSLSSLPAALLPPVVFGGLLVTLWTYKCLMMVVFQNKIIYMPSMPPFSRSEKVEVYTNQCRPITWDEHRFLSTDGTQLYCLEGTIPPETPITKRLVILYFQGNGSSLPPRLPGLSDVLKSLNQEAGSCQVTVLALSYRGYWKSSGRPSQKGIELDAQAFLSWATRRYANDPRVNFLLWGQSIGAGVATTALATWLKQNRSHTAYFSIHGLLLETPFTSLRAMLLALYPQKFLPYRYLGPFLLSTWNSDQALQEVGRIADEACKMKRTTSGPCPGLKVLLLEAASDELVPKGEAEKLAATCRRFAGIDVQHKVIAGAFHTNVIVKGQGRREISRFILDISKGSGAHAPITTR